MKIFLTGGSGFLGQYAIRSLIGDGHEVFALVRGENSKFKVSQLGATPIVGDLATVVSAFNQLSGIEAVVHCAAPMEFWGEWPTFEHGIIDATLALAEAAALKGVKKFVHISSESVLQDKEALLDIDESFPYPAEPNSFYGKAKKIAEERLFKLNTSMQVIILRPTFIWGTECPALTTISQKVQSGQFVWIDHGKSSFEAVHVENVAESIRLAIQSDKKGIYFVTDGESSSVHSFFQNIFAALGLAATKNSMPRVIIAPLAGVLESIWKVFRIKAAPPLTRFDFAFVAMPRRYRIDKIRKDLGYRPIVTRAEGFSKLAKSRVIL